MPPLQSWPGDHRWCCTQTPQQRFHWQRPSNPGYPLPQGRRSHQCGLAEIQASPAKQRCVKSMHQVLLVVDQILKSIFANIRVYILHWCRARINFNCCHASPRRFSTHTAVDRTLHWLSSGRSPCESVSSYATDSREHDHCSHSHCKYAMYQLFVFAPSELMNVTQGPACTRC